MLCNKNAYRKDKLTLVFFYKQEEAKFIKVYNTEALFFLRTSLVWAIILVALFSFLDIYYSNHYKSLLEIRFFVFIPSLILEIYLTSFKFIKKNLQFFTFIFGVLSSWNIIILLYFFDLNNKAYGFYYAGIIAVLLSVCLGAKIRFVYSIYTTAVSLISYTISALFIEKIYYYNKGYIFINNISFLLTCSIICVFGSFLYEKLYREDYVKKQLLEIEKENIAITLNDKQIAENKLTELNKNLENIINAKTVELEAEKQKSIRSLIEGKELESERISRDLHDGLCIELATTKHKLEYALKNNNNDFIKEAITNISDVIETARNISHNLSPYFLKRFGLKQALINYFEKLENTPNIKFNLFFHGMDYRFEEIIEINLYRIIKELSINIIKHSFATEADLQLVYNNENINITFSDNGKGFRTKEIGNGIGLNNIKTRVGLIKGTINIDSSPNSGTTVIININLQK